MLVLMRLTTISKESAMKMSDSGQKINYTLRPAKCVERKILCELLMKFNTPIPIHEYRYIGFGSFYFSDFVLFHNQLNIEQMISIEKSSNEERYIFNKPYNNIEIYFGDSETVLSTKIDFSNQEIKNVIWLDYDGAFQNGMISDLFTVSQKVSKGSFVFISLNPTIPKDKDKCMLPYLEKEAGSYLPRLKEKDVDNDTIPVIIYDIFYAVIQNSLLARNVKEDSPVLATPIFFIRYKDGAPMLTIGYYYTDSSSLESIQPTLSNIPWVNTDKSPQKLSIPCLTRSEIRELNRMLPGTPISNIHERMPYLSEADIEKYISVYKYYPNYLDSPYYV